MWLSVVLTLGVNLFAFVAAPLFFVHLPLQLLVRYAVNGGPFEPFTVHVAICFAVALAGMSVLKRIDNKLHYWFASCAGTVSVITLVMYLAAFMLASDVQDLRKLLNPTSIAYICCVASMSRIAVVWLNSQYLKRANQPTPQQP